MTTASAIYDETHHMPHAIFDTLAYATKQDLTRVEKELKRDMRELEERITYKLTIRLGSMIIAAVMILAVLIKIL